MRQISFVKVTNWLFGCSPPNVHKSSELGNETKRSLYAAIDDWLYRMFALLRNFFSQFLADFDV